MKLITFVLLAFKLYIIILTAQMVDSQYVPKTCKCPQVQIRVQRPLLDFSVTPKGPSCLQNEIIVIQRKNKKPVCLSPEGPQGKKLIKCWHRMQKDGKDHKSCLRQQKQKPRQRNGKQAKSKKVTS